MSLLTEVCRYGNYDNVKLLLDSGVDVNSKDRYWNTALICASEEGHKDIVELLLNSGADVNADGDFGWTALMWACEKGHKEIVELLEKHIERTKGN